MTTPITPEPSAEALAAYDEHRFKQSVQAMQEIVEHMQSFGTAQRFIRIESAREILAQMRAIDAEFAALRAENEASKNALEVIQHAHAEISGAYLDRAKELTDLRARLEGAEEDSKRLDWMETGGWGILSGWNSSDRMFRVQRIEYDPPDTTIAAQECGTIRYAIDAAMSTPSAKPDEGGK